MRAADQWVCSTAARCMAPRQIAALGGAARKESSPPGQRREVAWRPAGARSLAWVQAARSQAS